MKAIVLLPLSQGKFAMIDSDDFEKVGRVKWSAEKKKGGNFYAVRSVGGRKNRKRFYLHNALLGIKGVDHKNGDGLDCRRDNLRPATPQQQQRAFRRKAVGCSSKYRGVSWNSGVCQWQVHIKIGNKRLGLGCFKDEVEAAKRYDAVAKAANFFSEALNFP